MSIHDTKAEAPKCILFLNLCTGKAVRIIVLSSCCLQRHMIDSQHHDAP